ncbi:MAG: SPFH domain-containing protein, partial [Clostridia bacterium]|nr:SPFH domain-containing protein [Clostridia bacterium]
MTEKTLNNRKNGLPLLLLFLLLHLASAAGIIIGAVNAWIPLIIVSILIFVVILFLYPGLKVLKPQEALVLTLFGNYIGTLRGEGFYFVNPFCAAMNPAAKTRLNQSGDVDGNAQKSLVLNAQGAAVAAELPLSNKISLKIMTLNNSRQKINDCLGN